jgi:hypothetical protein
MKTNNRLPSALLLALLLAGCQPAEEESPAAPSGPSGMSLLLESEPPGALSVSEAVSRLQPGDPAVVYGRIGATVDPFIDGFAGFVLGDAGLVYCDEMGDGDHCATPWDACCEDPDKIAAGRASVLFTDATGKPLTIDLPSAYGLAGLDHVVVTGTVAEESTPANLVLHASGFYRRAD